MADQPDEKRGQPRLFRLSSWREAKFFAEVLRMETVGGAPQRFAVRAPACGSDMATAPQRYDRSMTIICGLDGPRPCPVRCGAAALEAAALEVVRLGAKPDARHRPNTGTGRRPRC